MLVARLFSRGCSRSVCVCAVQLRSERGCARVCFSSAARHILLHVIAYSLLTDGNCPLRGVSSGGTQHSCARLSQGALHGFVLAVLVYARCSFLLSVVARAYVLHMNALAWLQEILLPHYIQNTGDTTIYLTGTVYFGEWAL